MRRTSTVALIALLPLTWWASQAGATKVAYPGGEAVYNPSCYGDYDDEVAHQGPSGSVGGGVAVSGGPPPMRAPLPDASPSPNLAAKRPAKTSPVGSKTGRATPQAPAAEAAPADFAQNVPSGRDYKSSVDVGGDAAAGDSAPASPKKNKDSGAAHKADEASKKAEAERQANRYDAADSEDEAAGMALEEVITDDDRRRETKETRVVTAARAVMDWARRSSSPTMTP